jgi:hypothetical protein
MDRNPARLYALIVGAVLTAAGILGFFYISDFSTGGAVPRDAVLGLLDVNGWHNLVHLATGLLAYRSLTASRAYAFGLGASTSSWRCWASSPATARCSSTSCRSTPPTTSCTCSSAPPGWLPGRPAAPAAHRLFRHASREHVVTDAESEGQRQARTSRQARAVRALQRRVVNPFARALVAIGLLPTHLVLETRGPRLGRPRQAPVGYGQ